MRLKLIRCNDSNKILKVFQQCNMLNELQRFDFP